MVKVKPTAIIRDQGYFAPKDKVIVLLPEAKSSRGARPRSILYAVLRTSIG